MHRDVTHSATGDPASLSGVCDCGDEQILVLARTNLPNISRFCPTRHLNMRAVIQPPLVNGMSSNLHVQIVLQTAVKVLGTVRTFKNGE